MADEGASRQITLRHLLTHTSGIPGDAHRFVWEDPKTYRASLERSVRALQHVKLATPPGQRFEYANMGYAVLGLVVEAVSGQRWGNYMEENILRRLGMNHNATDSSRARDLDIAAEHGYRFGRLTEVEHGQGPWMAPAGSTLVASANDLGRYMLAQMGAIVIPHIKPSTLQEAHHGGAEMGRGERYKGLDQRHLRRNQAAEPRRRNGRCQLDGLHPP